MDLRIGHGFDSHAFKAGVPLRIGGLDVPHHEGLAGHSDGDVLLHALTDALLGAVAAGDIGTFFPPSDPQWKNADSSIFLNLALEEIQHAGFRIVNVDATLVLAAPKISPIAGEIRERLAILLDVLPNRISIKAKTPEGLSQDGAAQAHAVVLLQKVESVDDLVALQVPIEEPISVDIDDVEDLLAEAGTGVKRVAPFDTEDIT
jgi:2-C-methyl-D-erythritol 2,4-cyclodiphosphate synthase